MIVLRAMGTVALSLRCWRGIGASGLGTLAVRCSLLASRVLEGSGRSCRRGERGKGSVDLKATLCDYPDEIVAVVAVGRGSLMVEAFSWW